MSHELISGLLSFLNRSPTPYHAVEGAIGLLANAGFRRLREGERWQIKRGDRVFVTRADATIAAFVLGHELPSTSGFRLIGAHTDSPNLRLKPNADLCRWGYAQLGVEPYGGVLFSTWLDRDLSLAGRLFIQRDPHPEAVLVDLRAPLLRIPNLAIHLNRGVNVDGLKLNAQQHLVPVLGLEAGAGPTLLERLATAATEAGIPVTPDQILGSDLCLYDVQPAALGGDQDAFIFAARLDNLASCYSAICALTETSHDCGVTTGIVLFDHEEVGSRSAQGANSPFLETTLARLVAGLGDAESDAMHRAMSNSMMISCDAAHAVHPNYAEMHDGNHRPLLGAGPVIKRNAGQSYATDAESHAAFLQVCRSVDVTPQHFVTRSDLGCGSTIGPISAGRLGMRTIDVGNPMLSMHSIREMAATADVHTLTRVLRAFFT